jgi:hypothetical protein
MYCKYCKPVVRCLNEGTKRAPGRFAFIISIARLPSWDFLWAPKVWANTRIVSFTLQVNNNRPMVCVNLDVCYLVYTVSFDVNLLQTQICCFSVNHATDITLLNFRKYSPYLKYINVWENVHYLSERIHPFTQSRDEEWASMAPA